MSGDQQSDGGKSAQASPAQIEGVKLLYDYLKHLTTLSTGSIVVITTMWSKTPASAHASWAAIASLFLFVVCILGSVVAKGVLAVRAEKGDFSETNGLEESIEAYAALVAMAAFFMAVIGLAYFGAANLAA